MAVILSAGGSFACFYILLKLPMTISIYLALPFALPFALAGYVRIHGMSPFEYLRKKRKAVKSAILTRQPSYVADTEQIMAEIYKKRVAEKAETVTVGKKVLLQTEAEIFLRTKEFEKIHEYENRQNQENQEKRNNQLSEGNDEAMLS